MKRDGLLVVAGEASGDRAGAAVLRAMPGVSAFGLGGPALRAAGMETMGDSTALAVMGALDPLRRSAAIALFFSRIVAWAYRRSPRAALLVNYSEFNLRLAPILHRMSIRTLWYVAPQTWAWRASRRLDLRGCVDRMATVFPFEVDHFRAAGIDADFVGHPALEISRMDRNAARRHLGMTDLAPAVAILPGSRPGEVERHLPTMLDAYDLVRRDRASLDARVLIPASLGRDMKNWVERAASKRNVGYAHVDSEHGAIRILPAFEAALTASGTASLECAIARAVPVIVYRVDRVTEALARVFVRTPCIGLPNIVLGRRVFSELVQQDFTAENAADALDHALVKRSELVKRCAEVEQVLRPERRASEGVANLLAPWFGRAACEKQVLSSAMAEGLFR